MKTTNHATSRAMRAFAAATFTLASQIASADTKMFFANSRYPERFSVPGGTWDAGATTGWSSDGGSTLGAWTSSEDVARFALVPLSGNAFTMTIDGSKGDVAVAGIVIDGELENNRVVKFNGSGISIGAEGFKSYLTNHTSTLTLNIPVTLTAAQTWMVASKMPTMQQGSTFYVKQPITSTFPICFDGGGMTDPGLANKANSRPGFNLESNNNISASITVSGGAFLVAKYTTAAPGPKLSPSSPLILEGGMFFGTSASSTPFSESVPSVVVRKGHNCIFGNNATLTFLCGTVAREGRGGTIDFSSSANGGVSSYVSNENSNGIIGGWATCDGTRFAAVGEEGLVSQIPGSQRTVATLSNGDNALLHGEAVTRTSDVSVEPNSLGIHNGGYNNLGSATLTIRSGGLLSRDAATNYLGGGTIKTGMDTGELFVHTAKPLVLSSALADNGDIPGVLVKSGVERLVLSGENGFTGETYLNSGTLSIEGNAVLSTPVFQAGGTTLRTADGGTLAPASGWTLGGSLAIGDGATLRLSLNLDAAAPISVTNRFSSVVLEDGAAAAIQFVWADGVTPKTGAYPILTWGDGVEAGSVDATAFQTEFPDGTAGALSVSGNALVLTVTEVPSGGTVVIFR